MTVIEPTAWKKFHGLRGKEKETSRQRALMLFPAAHALFARRKDQRRCEAALLALYGANLITPTMSAATITTRSEVQHETA